MLLLSRHAIRLLLLLLLLPAMLMLPLPAAVQPQLFRLDGCFFPRQRLLPPLVPPSAAMMPC